MKLPVTNKKPYFGIQMKLNTKQPMVTQNPLINKKPAVASVFNNDSDEEVEEMPAEARMKMRNIGRDTPTSSGPNSYGKTKEGFINHSKIYEKQLKNMMPDN